MEEWYCFKCEEKMVEKDILASYFEMEGDVRALQCPKCKTAYLSEQTTIEVVNEAEAEIETKE
jgi:NAD-dependent SIR2 family protein deacetylase